MATIFKEECCVLKLKMVYSKHIQMKETWKLVLKVFTCHFPKQCVVLAFYFPFFFSTALSAKFNSKGEERILDSKGV